MDTMRFAFKGSFRYLKKNIYKIKKSSYIYIYISMYIYIYSSIIAKQKWKLLSPDLSGKRDECIEGSRNIVL